MEVILDERECEQYTCANCTHWEPTRLDVGSGFCTSRNILTDMAYYCNKWEDIFLWYQKGLNNYEPRDFENLNQLVENLNGR